MAGRAGRNFIALFVIGAYECRLNYKFAPLTNAPSTPGLSRTKRLCLRRKVLCIAGSIYIILELMGDILFGSPTFAMPLKIRYIVSVGVDLQFYGSLYERNAARIDLCVSFT
ncbi:hypothetical protein GQX74_001961 [Glossina fuscipes]|nr:hypothetical protein GQX74_001961 [Glossina fuscipes]